MWWWIACSGPAAEKGEAPAEPAAPATARLDTWRAMAEDLRAVRHPSDGGGTASLIDGPSSIQAGEAGSWTVRFEAGPLGVAAGGRIFLQSSPFWGWSPAQTVALDGEGYTTAGPLPEGVTLTPRTQGEGLVSFEVQGRALGPGEELLLTYGGRADRFAESESALWLAVDGDGDGVRKTLPKPILVAVTGRPPVGWQVTLPSVAEPGGKVRLTLAPLDAVGNAFFPWRGEVALSLPPGLAGPASVAIDTVGSAMLAAEKPGIYTVAVHSADGLAGRSNPLVVRSGAEPILWGDLQVHTAASDGTGTLDDVYRYARDVAALDFAAITDHDHWGMRFLDADPAGWRAAAAAAARWTEAGRFVALPGYEWTSWIHGHRHVVGFDGPPPLCSSMDPACDTPTELWAALRGSGALTFAHHQAGGPVATDWSFAPDPALEPVTEVASVHGQSESPDGPGVIYGAVAGNFVRDSLVSRRYILGFVGSTDGHDGHPGLSQLAGGGGGLAAVMAREDTAGALREALLARRTYATNGVRMVLRFTLDEHPMGSVLPPQEGPMHGIVRVVGTAPITAIEVIHGAIVSDRFPGDGSLTGHAEFTVSGLTAGEFVYVRVLQADGGAAWSSPVFFAN
jgi:hypothetical protein